jgi:hypothetical protein
MRNEWQTVQIHAHVWVDPDDPLIERAPYSPVIGPRRREMKPGKMYHCRECTAVVSVPILSEDRSNRQ